MKQDRAASGHFSRLGKGIPLLLSSMLEAVATFSMKRRGSTILVCLLLAVISTWYSISHLKLKTSQRDLISHQRGLGSISEQLEEIDDLDNLVVVVENRNRKRAIAFIERLAARLRMEKGLYRELFYRIDPELLRPWWLLYLDEEELSGIRRKLEDHSDFIEGLVGRPDINQLFSLINRELTSNMVEEIFTGFLKEQSGPKEAAPVDLSFLIAVLKGLESGLNGADAMIPAWDSFFVKEKWDPSGEGYLWTDKKKYILLFMTPREEGDTFNKAASALHRLRKILAEVKNEFPGIDAGVTGPDALKADEMTVAFADMKLATWISLAGVALIMVIFLRGFYRPFAETMTLVIALCWSFGLATLIVGHLNLLSMIFAPMLLGLGIDYGIHWFVRLQEEEEKGLPLERAIQNAMKRSGPAILIAGITASASYFPMVLTGFKGLAELGLISGIGILMTLLASVLLLPSFVMLGPRRSKATRKKLNHRLQAALERSPLSKPPIILPAGGLITLAALATIPLVDFDFNPLHLQAKDAEAVRWEMRLLEDSKRSSMYGAVTARSLDEARRKIKALEALPTVSKVHSVLRGLPKDQSKKRLELDQLKKIIPTDMRLSPRRGSPDLAQLQDMLSRIRFKMVGPGEKNWGSRKPLASQMEEVRELIDEIRSALREHSLSWIRERLRIYSQALFSDLSEKLEVIKANIYSRPMTIDDLPEPFLKRNMGSGNIYLLRVWPNENIWDREPLERFVKDLLSVEPNAAGDPVTLYVFTNAFRKACIYAAIYALVFIFLFASIYFRSILYSFLALTPLLVGAVWTVGLMWLFDIKFNVANSIFLPLIVGAGVEYGIIIISRCLENPDGLVGYPLKTFKGVILASLTTTLGFGSLMISQHQGVKSLGLLATVGSISVMVAALTILPPALMVIASRVSPRTTHRLP